MFLLYAPLGALIPFFTAHLENDLGFSSFDIGMAAAAQAIGSLVAPLLAGQIADRWVSPERCLWFCASLAGTLLWILASATAAPGVFALSVAFWLAMAPVLSLGTAVVFIHLTSPEWQFGRVRLWGTVGWAVQGWVLGLWFSQPEWLVGPLRNLGLLPGSLSYAAAFRLGSILSFVLGLFALTLPVTPPRGHLPTRLAPLQAIRLFRRPSFAVFFLCNLALCVTIPFSTQATPLFLQHLGISRDWLGPVMTVSQSLEIVALGLLPFLLRILGLRRTMLIGAVSWATMLSMLTVGKPVGLVIASLGLSGLYVCFFMIVGQVYVNSQATSDIRASAQALIAFSNGLGLLGGHLLAGWVRGLS